VLFLELHPSSPAQPPRELAFSPPPEFFFQSLSFACHLYADVFQVLSALGTFELLLPKKVHTRVTSKASQQWEEKPTCCFNSSSFLDRSSVCFSLIIRPRSSLSLWLILGVTVPSGSSPICEIALAMELWEAVIPAEKKINVQSTGSNLKINCSYIASWT